jgi:circadian clock protein KaiC
MEMDGGRVSTGIEGVDRVLRGGLLPERAYLLRGGPGTGKTVFGGQYLTAAGGKSLFITFEESATSIRENAARMGFDLEEVTFLDMSPGVEEFVEDRRYDVFEPDEVEAESVTGRIVDAVDKHDPDRVFVDPLTRLRHLTPDDYRFRKETASFMRYLTGGGATVVFTTQPSTTGADTDLQFISDGTLELGREAKGRTFTVTKFRGSDFRDGHHTLRIDDDGISVYPKLRPAAHERVFEPVQSSSGVEGLDALLDGGLDRGTVTVVSGPTGVGKTTTATAFARQAAIEEQPAAVYLFEESVETFTHRAAAVDVPVDDLRDAGTFELEAVEPLARSADEFAATVRAAVEDRGVSTVVIDGISGYRLSIRGDDEALVRELHALCRYLTNVGVTVVLIDDLDSVTGAFEPTSRRISYLADTIFFLRYLELGGELRKAAGVLKRRTGDFERALREFEITGDGIRLGDPLTGLRGILTGTPEWSKEAAFDPARISQKDNGE